jgi:hypothetical protein
MAGSSKDLKSVSPGHQDVAAPRPLPGSWLTWDLEAAPVERTALSLASQWRIGRRSQGVRTMRTGRSLGPSLSGSSLCSPGDLTRRAESEGANADVAEVGQPRGRPINYCARTKFCGRRLCSPSDIARTTSRGGDGGTADPRLPHIHDYCRIFCRRLQAVCEDSPEKRPYSRQRGPVQPRPVPDMGGERGFASHVSPRNRRSPAPGIRE